MSSSSKFSKLFSKFRKSTSLEESKHTPSFFKIPTEIFLLILHGLPHSTLLSFALASRFCYNHALYALDVYAYITDESLPNFVKRVHSNDPRNSSVRFCRMAFDSDECDPLLIYSVFSTLIPAFVCVQYLELDDSLPLTGWALLDELALMVNTGLIGLSCTLHQPNKNDFGEDQVRLCRSAVAYSVPC